MSLEFIGFEQPQNEALDFGVVMHVSQNWIRSFCSSKTFKFSGLHMANVALEVAAAAFGKIEKNQRNLFQKSGNRPKWLFLHFFFAPCAVRHLAQSLSSQLH